MSYFVYILSNPARTVLYIGMSNDLERRLYEHSRGL
ncbi:GIY-YIG nuclease family protein [Hymenobacter tenuis]